MHGLEEICSYLEVPFNMTHSLRNANLKSYFQPQSLWFFLLYIHIIMAR